MSPSDPREVLVLTSGGIDSAACIDFFSEMRRPTCGLFIDYGQAAAPSEERAAAAVAAHYDIPLMKLSCSTRQPKGSGLIPNRNAFLVAAAAMERPAGVLVIALGIHSGTSYPDCTQAFLDAAQAAIALGEPQPPRLSAPFVSWSKSEVYEYCRQRRVPIELTYSCESAVLPCRRCLSCCDREVLDC